MAKFILKYKNAKLREIPIDKETLTIGRDADNDIIIENLAVSRHHARLVQKEDKFILEDLNSFNGTFINEEKIDKGELNEGDQIIIGKHILIFLKQVEVNPKRAKIKRTKSIFVENTCLLETKKQRELTARDQKGRAKEEEKLGELRGVISYISDRGEVKEVVLNKKVTIIGKGENADIKVKGFFIGKSTLLIKKDSDGFYISRGDRRSSPKLNGKIVKEQKRLRDNDFIEVGSTEMQFNFKDF